MLFIVRFDDKPGTGELRKELLPKHIEFLDSKKDQVLVAGSLREIPSDQSQGGLWIVEAEDKAGVEAVFENDPFWVNGLRAAYHVHRWQKAFPDRKVAV